MRERADAELLSGALAVFRSEDWGVHINSAALGQGVRGGGGRV